MFPGALGGHELCQWFFPTLRPRLHRLLDISIGVFFGHLNSNMSKIRLSSLSPPTPYLLLWALLQEGH